MNDANDSLRNRALLLAMAVAFLAGGCSDIKERLGKNDSDSTNTHVVEDEHGDEHGEHEEHEPGMVHLSPDKLDTLNITVVPIHAGTVDSVLSLPAEIALDPDNEAHVVPRVPGIVRSVHAGIGDVVEGGQLLAVIESRELARAKSEYLTAVATRELAHTTFLREEKLWQDKISAEQDYLQAKAAYQAAQINVDAAEQALHALGLTQTEVEQLPNADDTSLTRYEIHAPFRATVIKRHIALGETVGDEDVFLLAKLDPVWAMGRATERDIRRLRVGQKVAIQLDALPGDEFTGTIDYISSVLDPQGRTVDIRVVLPNPEKRLRAGLFGRMMVFVSEHAHDAAFLLPNDALQRTEGGTIVYREAEPGVFEAVTVSVLHASQTHTEVQGELADGDRIAAGNLFVLKSEAGKESMGGGHSH
jgi:cobalt-zinc-cadmium efflux system membrane fusion protein